MATTAPNVRRRHQGLGPLSPDLIDKASDETDAQVVRLMLAFVGTAAFCLLSLASPDSGLLTGNQHVLAKPVVGWAGLTTYLLKEATPQAWYGAKKGFRRIKGSIPLGELGGDRVVLSNDLRDTLVRNGKIEPYRRTYAKRLPKVSTQPIMQAVEPVSLKLSRAA